MQKIDALELLVHLDSKQVDSLHDVMVLRDTDFEERQKIDGKATAYHEIFKTVMQMFQEANQLQNVYGNGGKVIGYFDPDEKLKQRSEPHE